MKSYHCLLVCRLFVSQLRFRPSLREFSHLAILLEPVKVLSCPTTSFLLSLSLSYKRHNLSDIISHIVSRASTPCWIGNLRLRRIKFLYRKSAFKPTVSIAGVGVGEGVGEGVGFGHSKPFKGLHGVGGGVMCDTPVCNRLCIHP